MFNKTVALFSVLFTGIAVAISASVRVSGFFHLWGYDVDVGRVEYAGHVV